MAKVGKTKTAIKKRKRIPPGVRYDALVRANFRCEGCGVLAKNARLEIDHIKPIAQGGTNAATNLQVLCVSCNRGKGAKLRKVAKPKKDGKPNPKLVIPRTGASKRGGKQARTRQN